MKGLPIIRENFTDINGRIYEGVREIAFKRSECGLRLGNYKAATHREDKFINGSDDTLYGVYIYQSFDNPDVGYRIHKTFADYGFNSIEDAKLIEQLLKKQDKVKYAKFPTGVVTLDGKVIGQEIVYFKDRINLFEYSATEHKNINPIKIYKAILDILKDLYDNGIVYIDSHSKNYMINPNIEQSDKIDLEIIDYEKNNVIVENFCNCNLESAFFNYRTMIEQLNERFGIIEKTGKHLPVANFEDAYCQLEEMQKKLRRG